MANGDITNNDIMDFLQTNMVMRSEFAEFKEDVDKRFESVDKRFENLEQKVGPLENQMVTKDYLDRKLADLGAEIGRRINRQAEVEMDFRKILIDILSRKAILENSDLERLKKFV